MIVTATARAARYLLDTNILLRRADQQNPAHPTAIEAVARLLAEGATMCITAQNLIEFWAVATRPAEKNGLGWDAAKTQSELAKLQAAFTLLPDSPAILPRWERLVQLYGVQGVQVHDTRLAAVALVYGVENLLTFNAKDFRRFAPEGLTVVEPATLSAAPIPRAAP